MGHFNVQTQLTGPTGLTETVDLFVDTGATLVILPRAVADRLALRPAHTCQVELAGGAVETWPVAEIRVAIEGRGGVLCQADFSRCRCGRATSTSGRDAGRFRVTRRVPPTRPVY